MFCTLQGPATELLEVDVQSAPGLYQETSPAVWQRCHDFTGGEASCLRCAPAIAPTMDSCCFQMALDLSGDALLPLAFACTVLHCTGLDQMTLFTSCDVLWIHGPTRPYSCSILSRVVPSNQSTFCRTQKVLFPANTVMNLLQDLVLREPRLGKLTTNQQPVAPCPSGTLPCP